MKSPGIGDLDLAIARARIVFSLVALLSIYIDPTTAGGFLRLEPFVLATLLLHLTYSVATYLALKRFNAGAYLLMASVALDVSFATVLAFMTEGATSPAYAFFIFAIIAGGYRFKIWASLGVTLLSVALYLVVIALSPHGLSDAYMMRAVYLAIVGYLIEFFGEQRARFEARLRELESAAERQLIALELHDGYVQALAGINLRLEVCRQLLSSQRSGDALTQITDLQTGVTREYDEVRDYIRTLAGTEPRGARDAAKKSADTRFRVRADFTSSGVVVEHVMQIMLEGMRNAWKHGKPLTVSANASSAGGSIRITIDDDGHGFGAVEDAPWAIALRVAEVGGRLSVDADAQAGAHLEIEIPAA
jgi:signal transduction histidine kinase